MLLVRLLLRVVGDLLGAEHLVALECGFSSQAQDVTQGCRLAPSLQILDRKSTTQQRWIYALPSHPCPLPLEVTICWESEIRDDLASGTLPDPV